VIVEKRSVAEKTARPSRREREHRLLSDTLVSVNLKCRVCSCTRECSESCICRAEESKGKEARPFLNFDKFKSSLDHHPFPPTRHPSYRPRLFASYLSPSATSFLRLLSWPTSSPESRSSSRIDASRKSVVRSAKSRPSSCLFGSRCGSLGLCEGRGGAEGARWLRVGRVGGSSRG
jgi:hypothetical protein